MTKGEPELTEAERLVLATLMEPFVFMPDGLLEPLSVGRMREMWWTAHASEVAAEIEPA